MTRKKPFINLSNPQKCLKLMVAIISRRDSNRPIESTMIRAFYTYEIAIGNLVSCGLCGRPILNIDELSVDHKIPRSAGGLDLLSNYQPAHSFCNTLRGSMSEIEFRQRLIECNNSLELLRKRISDEYTAKERKTAALVCRYQITTREVQQGLLESNMSFKLLEQKLAERQASEYMAIQKQAIMEKLERNEAYWMKRIERAMAVLSRGCSVSGSVSVRG